MVRKRNFSSGDAPSKNVKGAGRLAYPKNNTSWILPWRQRGKEIDIVVDYPNIDNILIEVKYREEAPFLMMT